MNKKKLIEKTKGFYKKSFTLIELIVVIVVIGILSAIVIPNIATFKDEAKQSAMVSDERNLQTAVDMYQLENHGDFPTQFGEGESSKPAFGEPKAVDFDALFPEYIRDLPQHVGMYYWIDYQGKIYLSTIDNPDDFKQDANGLSWTANDQAAGYEVYEVESSNTSASKRALLKSVGNLKGSVNNLTPVEYAIDKTYVISVVDAYGNQAAPVKNTYSGVVPYVPESNEPLTPEQEVLVSNPANKMVAVGMYHTLVVDENGGLWSFGRNYFGELGYEKNIGLNASNSTPVQIMTDVKSVSAGDYHTIVLKKNGEVWSFGYNFSGQLGHNVNVGSGVANPEPTRIMTDAKLISAGSDYTLVVKKNGELLSFGGNKFGQLGHATNSNTTNPNPIPQQVMSNVQSVFAGYRHTLVITTTSELWTFGTNQYGQLGHETGTIVSSVNPIPRQIMTDVQSGAAGKNHSLVLKTNGELWTFGTNQYGQLGRTTNNNTGNPNSTPQLVMTDVQTVSSGYDHTLVVKKNAELWTFGVNNEGQLGHADNLTTMNANPTPRQVLSEVQSAGGGSVHSVIVKTNGEIWTIGKNQYGRLGSATNGTKVSIPQQLHLPTE